MKRPSTIHIADILVLAAVVALFLLNPMSFYHRQPSGIPDKVEICYQRTQPAAVVDSLVHSVEAEMAEMDYYLRLHSVDDDGFQLVGLYNARLQAEYQQLKRQQQQTQQSGRRILLTRRIAAKDRPMIAV